MQNELEGNTPSPQEIQPQKRVGIFIDDNAVINQRWADAFTCPQTDCRTSPRDEEEAKIFYDSFSDEELSRVDVVVADQRYNKPETRQFITRLRSVNTQAFILEVSGHLQGQAFPGSNAQLEKSTDTTNIVNIIEDTPILGMKLAKFKLYSDQARIEAQKADPYSEYSQIAGQMSEIYAKRSFGELIDDRLLPDLLRLLQTTKDDFFSRARDDNDIPKLRDILHESWNIVSMLRSGGVTEDDYARPIDRLKIILGLIPRE